MRKTFFYLAVCTIALTSCSSEEDITAISEAPIPSELNADCSLRSESEAKDAAIQAIQLLEVNKEKSRSSIQRTLDTSLNPIAVYSNSSSKSRSNENEKLMYIVNYADEQGFAIIAANKAVTPIIGVVGKGSYLSNEPTGVPAFDFYMDNVKDYLSTIQNDNQSVGMQSNITGLGTTPMKPMPEYKCEIDTTWYANVAPRVQVEWGQEYPEGNNCPNKISGCSNTAAAMSMTYFEEPKQIELSYKSYEPLTLDWADIKKHANINNKSDCSSCTSYTHSAISDLCRELGNRAGSQYYINPSATGTTIDGIMFALNSFGYTTSIHYPSKRSAALHLQTENSVLIMCGTSKDGNSHMWLCDGAVAYNVVKTYFVWNKTSPYDVIPVWEVFERTDEERSYCHYNWGWNGKYNGSFLDLTYGATPAYNYDRNVKYIKVVRW